MLSDEWADVERQEQTLQPRCVSAALIFSRGKEKIHRPASGINFKLDIKHQERARHAPLVSVQTEGICGKKALMWLNSYWIKTNKVEVKPHYSAF